MSSVRWETRFEHKVDHLWSARAADYVKRTLQARELTPAVLITRTAALRQPMPPAKLRLVAQHGEIAMAMAVVVHFLGSRTLYEMVECERSPVVGSWCELDALGRITLDIPETDALESIQVLTAVVGGGERPAPEMIEVDLVAAR